MRLARIMRGARTLVELMVALAIIANLVSLMVPAALMAFRAAERLKG